MVIERQGTEDLSYALWCCFSGASCLSACRRRQDLLPDGCWREDHQKGDASVCQDRVAQICAWRRHTGFGRLGAEPWPPLPEGHFAGFGHACRDGGPESSRFKASSSARRKSLAKCRDIRQWRDEAK